MQPGCRSRCANLASDQRSFIFWVQRLISFNEKMNHLSWTTRTNKTNHIRWFYQLSGKITIINPTAMILAQINQWSSLHCRLTHYLKWAFCSFLIKSLRYLYLQLILFSFIGLVIIFLILQQTSLSPGSAAGITSIRDNRRAPQRCSWSVSLPLVAGSSTGQKLLLVHYFK